MLWVTEKRTEHGTWLILEGRLTGPWVDEVKRCWKRLLERGTGQATFIDVREVSFIDKSGKTLLSQMHRAGARLVSSGFLMNSVVVSRRRYHGICRHPGRSFDEAASSVVVSLSQFFL